MEWAQAKTWRSRLAGKKLVFTNGVFDLIHPGHVDVLLGARREGDALLVGLNGDASVGRIKGPDRPIRNEQERAVVLAALSMVDAVVLFDQDTPLELIQLLAPDVLVKGGDYSEATIVGADFVIVVPTTPGQSTTSIVEKLRGER
jgi:D-beta-D-heptose 7-phosphate kinase/D-beta-D-heptose 1-phosphate adenosyltransferase